MVSSLQSRSSDRKMTVLTNQLARNDVFVNAYVERILSHRYLLGMNSCFALFLEIDSI